MMPIHIERGQVEAFVRISRSNTEDENVSELNSDRILAKLFALRKEYDDDREDPTYVALHHACLFISYRIGEFKAYLKEAETAADEGAASTGDR
jgi:hypothetical protein